MRLRTADIASRTLGDETVILDLQGSRYLSVRGTGSRMLELLESDTTVDDVVAVIADEYDADPELVRVDTERFVAQLRDAGLLED